MLCFVCPTPPSTSVLTTSLSAIESTLTPSDAWIKHVLKTHFDQTDVVTYSQLVHRLGLSDTLRMCNIEPKYAPQWRAFAVWCAQRAAKYAPHSASLSALEIARLYSIGQATKCELLEAREAAWASEGARNWCVFGKGHLHIFKEHKLHLTVVGAAEWAIACACDSDRGVASKASLASRAATWWAARESKGDDMGATQELNTENRAHVDAFAQLCEHGTLPEVH